MSELKDNDIKEPEQVIELVFKAELSKAKPLSLDEMDSPFQEVSEAWDANHHYVGDEEPITTIVYWNLMRISQQPGFSVFRVEKRGNAIVQINAVFADLTVPMQVWRAGDKYYVNGDQDFGYDNFVVDDHITGDQPSSDEVNNSMWGEGAKCHDCDKGKLESTFWEGTKLTLIKSIPTLLGGPIAIIGNFLKTALHPDDSLIPAMQLKCSYCAKYGIRCPYYDCKHIFMLRERLPGSTALRCRKCDRRFRVYRDG